MAGIIEVIKKDYRMTLVFVLVAAIMGVVVAFSIPRIYKTTVVLAPEDASSGLMGNISSLASMVGMNMDFSQGGDAIYPEIYPDVIGSTDFIISLFPLQVTNKDKSITCDYATHWKEHTKAAWWDKAKHWVMESLKSDEPGVQKTRPANEPIDPFCLTRSEYDLYQAIKSSISCSVDKKTNVISITVTDQDPRVSAIVADSIQNRLQNYITDYRTKKAREDVQYLETICQEAKTRYASAQSALMAYSDAHLDAVLVSVTQNQEKLESEMRLRENIYSTVAQQLQLARSKVQEKTPAFTTIQRASIPLKHSNKPKILILGIFVFLALCLRALILSVKYRDILWTEQQDSF